ncbi:hypothetical protein ACQPW1_07380 [Nocardia sp. CA-128927]|uniref:hypothetical protein n=1 Tax=Nocardia sp. CA-128927 TaxID=3239975 RepID=UPI003D97F56C
MRRKMIRVLTTGAVVLIGVGAAVPLASADPAPSGTFTVDPTASVPGGRSSYALVTGTALCTGSFDVAIHLTLDENSHVSNGGNASDTIRCDGTLRNWTVMSMATIGGFNKTYVAPGDGRATVNFSTGSTGLARKYQDIQFVAQ